MKKYQTLLCVRSVALFRRRVSRGAISDTIGTCRRNLHRVSFALDLRSVSAAVAAAHHEHHAQEEHEDLG